MQNIKDHILCGEERYLPQYKAATERPLQLIKSYETRSDSAEERQLVDEARKEYRNFMGHFAEMLSLQEANPALSAKQFGALARGKSTKLTRIIDQMAEAGLARTAAIERS